MLTERSALGVVAAPAAPARRALLADLPRDPAARSDYSLQVETTGAVRIPRADLCAR